ncbi:MAG: hypothetical protein WD794_09555 [Mycobacteriales bacterium]
MSDDHGSETPSSREPTVRELRAARRRAHEEEKKRRGSSGGGKGGKGGKMNKGGNPGPTSDERSRR